MDYNLATIETYNKTANEYAENVKDLVPMGSLEKFVKYVPFGDILDIGAGSGVSAKNLQLMGLQVYGIDLSERLIDIARKESPDSVFYTMDMRDLHFFE